jgi:hypothetical protein
LGDNTTQAGVGGVFNFPNIDNSTLNFDYMNFFQPTSNYAADNHDVLFGFMDDAFLLDSLGGGVTI